METRRLRSQHSRTDEGRFVGLRAWCLPAALAVFVFATAGSARQQELIPESRQREYNAEVPKTILELQQFRVTQSIRVRSKAGREGVVDAGQPQSLDQRLVSARGGLVRSHTNPHLSPRKSESTRSNAVVGSAVPVRARGRRGGRSVFVRSVLGRAARCPRTGQKRRTHLCSLVRVTTLSQKPWEGTSYGTGSGDGLLSRSRLGWGRGDRPWSSSLGRCQSGDRQDLQGCAGRRIGSERTDGRARCQPRLIRNTRIDW